LVGLYFVIYAFQLFAQEQTISSITMVYAQAGFSFAMVGLITFFTGVILFTLSSVMRKGAS